MHTHKNFPGNDDLFRRLYNICRLLERLKTKAISSERVGLASMLEVAAQLLSDIENIKIYLKIHKEKKSKQAKEQTKYPPNSH